MSAQRSECTASTTAATASGNAKAVSPPRRAGTDFWGELDEYFQNERWSLLKRSEIPHEAFESSQTATYAAEKAQELHNLVAVNNHRKALLWERVLEFDRLRCVMRALQDADEEFLATYHRVLTKKKPCFEISETSQQVLQKAVLKHERAVASALERLPHGTRSEARLHTLWATAPDPLLTVEEDALHT